MGQLIRQIKKKNGLIRRFAEEEDAVGVVEIILILVVLIGLVVIFKNQLTKLVNNIFTRRKTWRGRWIYPPKEKKTYFCT